MLSFDNFKEAVKDDLKKYMPGDFQDREIDIVMVRRPGVEYEGLCFKPLSSSNEAVTVPVLPLESYYEMFLSCGELDRVLEDMANACVRGSKINVDTGKVDHILSSGEIGSYVFFELINKDNNSELLKSVPYKEYHDMAIVYRMRLSVDGQYYYMLITNKLVDKYNINVDALYGSAYENTIKFYPLTMLDLESALYSGVTGESPFIEYDDIEDIAKRKYAPPLILVTLEGGYEQERLGSTVLLYKEVFDEIARRFNDDIYIIPSSIHALLVCPCCMGSDDFIEVLRDMNTNRISAEHMLSNNLYRYDRTTKEIVVIS